MQRREGRVQRGEDGVAAASRQCGAVWEQREGGVQPARERREGSVRAACSGAGPAEGGCVRATC